jgi:hypothetical protein
MRKKERTGGRPRLRSMDHRRACPNGQLVVLTPRIIGSKVLTDIRDW